MKLASSVVLYRKQPALEILVVVRSNHMRFLSGFTAFPGGMVEKDDICDSTLETAKACAIRELSEELGIPNDTQETLRSNFSHIGTWTTPEYLVTSFETYFFAVEVDESFPELSPCDEEIESVEWIQPKQLSLRWEQCACLLAPPTQAIVRRLSEGGGVARLHDYSETAGLPPRYSRIRPYITLFPQITPTLPPATHTNCYLVGHDELIVIEPATNIPLDESALRIFLEDQLESGKRLRAIVITHHHHDHTVGVLALAEHFGMEIWAHPETAARVSLPIARMLHDGDFIELDGGVCLEIFHTPGHAPGHIVLLDDRSMSAIVGDMVAGVGTIIIDPDDDGDMKAYLDSLYKLRDIQPSCLLPSHGPVIGGSTEKLTEYIEHRLAREAKVLEAVRQSNGTLESIVQQSYSDTPIILRSGPGGGLAGRSALAHLNKLIHDGLIEGSVDEGFKLSKS